MRRPASRKVQKMDRFERHLERYRKPIYNYVVRLIGDSSTAEDIAQETFLRLFTELDRIRDKTVSAWLYRVARNLVTDYIRKKKAVPFTVLKGKSADSDDSPTLDFAGSDPGPHELSWQSELGQMIDKTLSAMSPKFRDVIVLVDVQGLTHEEAGEALGCSAKTVSARLARAREFFAGRMGRHVGLPANDSDTG